VLVELESMHERHLSVELSIANSGAARTLVLEGRAELGVIATEGSGPEESGLFESPFCDDEIVIAVPPGHPWASLQEIGPAELVCTPMIMRDPGASSRRVVSTALEALGLSLAPPLAEIGSTTAAISTAISEGVPVLLSSLALAGGRGEGLVPRKPAGLSFGRSFVVVHSGEESLPPPARALSRHLLTISKSAR
jgi:DNA-binding transcriptional LysR family regulator